MQIEPSQQFIRVGDIRRFCEKLSLAPRGHAFCRDGKFYDVYCFSDPEHAELFRKAFGGEEFDKAAHAEEQRMLKALAKSR